MSAQIFVIATPLGNLEDLSPRARRVLEEVDFIACEDTRRTGQLLQLLAIPKKELVSYYDAVEDHRAPALIDRIQEKAQSLALVSDAGTPAIADPGFRLIRLAHEANIPVIAVPGPSTLSTLISVSGLPSDRVLFVGFLPRKKNQLMAEIQSWKRIRASIVALETPPRVEAALRVIAELVPNAEICIGRELTKLHEELRMFSITEALDWAVGHTHLKGELALMIHIPVETESDADCDWDALLGKARFLHERGLTHKDLVEFLAHESIDRKELYQRLLTIH